MAWFYEIRSSNNVVLKRDSGFATQDAAKIAGRENAKKIKNARQLSWPSSCPCYVCNVRLAFGLPLLCSQPSAIDRYVSDRFYVVWREKKNEII
jgi:hypothetical protein